MNEFERLFFESYREIEKEKKDMKASRLRNAIKIIDEALEICPKEDSNWAVAMNNRAYCNAFLAKFDSTIADLKKSEGVDPDRYGLHINYSSVLDDKGCFDEALAHAEKAISLKPDPFEAYVNLSSIQCSLKQYEKAIESATKSMEICLTDKASTNRGIAYLELGDLEKAFEDLENVFKQNPDSLMGNANLGDFYLITGEKHAAKKEFEGVLRRVASFDKKDRSVRHYFPAIVAESGLKKLGIDSESNFSLEAIDFGIPEHFFED